MYEKIVITKPLYDNYVCIREKYVDRAIKNRDQLLIEIPQGRAIHNPKDWKLTGKIMEKVFLRPDEPMRLICNYANFKKMSPEEESLEMVKKGLI
jgi:hypothetical protein